MPAAEEGFQTPKRTQYKGVYDAVSSYFPLTWFFYASRMTKMIAADGELVPSRLNFDADDRRRDVDGGRQEASSATGPACDTSHGASTLLHATNRWRFGRTRRATWRPPHAVSLAAAGNRAVGQEGDGGKRADETPPRRGRQQPAVSSVWDDRSSTVPIRSSPLAAKFN
ncbi:hypothetical protein [Oryza sativa Japonica Group]|uniref:Uncharacterized protein n=2 Tax=Oryza sativa subsp. japonica TaxID=39947 RepID=Q7F1Z0_ORYSJ|nr:hypothetical protein [Oryza sativa Japonica Group]BAB93421.1 hypothetical protein [Oryza sativa Japonica Group]